MYLTLVRNIDTFLSSPSVKRIVHGSKWHLLGTAVYRVCTLIGAILVARKLGAEEFGEFGVVRSTLMTFLVFAGLGLGTTASRYLAQYNIEDKERAGKIFALSQVSALVVGFLISFALYLFAQELSEKMLNNPNIGVLLKVVAVAVFFSSLIMAQNGAIAGLEGFRSQSKVYFLLGPFSIASLFLLTLNFGVIGSVSALAVNTFLHFILNKFLLSKLLSKNELKAGYRSCFEEAKLLYRYSLPVALGSMLVTPVLWIANSMLVSQDNGYSEFGYLEAANQIRMLILFIPTVGAQVVLPVLASMNVDVNASNQRKMLFFNVCAAAIAAVGILIPVVIFSEVILSLYGEEFALEGRFVLMLMASSSVFTALNVVMGQALASRDFVWFGLCFNTLWACSLLGFTQWFLSMNMGAEGLAMANLLSYILHTLWSAIFCYIKYR